MSWSEAEYAAYMERFFTGPQGAITTYRASSLPDEPEASFQARVLRLAKANGFLVYHTRDSRGSEKGFPDLVLCRPPDVLFAELKTRTGKSTQEQAVWLDMLSKAGQETYIWRPADYPTIEARLTQPWRKVP